MSSDNLPEQNSIDTLQGTTSSDNTAQVLSESINSTIDNSAISAVYSSYSYSGSFPPIEYMQFFEQTNPGSTQLLLNYYSEEQQHRHSIQNQQLELEVRKEANRHSEEIVAMISSIVIVALFLIALIVALRVGVTEGIITGVGEVIVTVVTLFLYKRKKKE